VSKKTKKRTWPRQLITIGAIGLSLGSTVFGPALLERTTFSRDAVARVAQRPAYFAAAESLKPSSTTAPPAPPSTYAIPILMYHYVRDYRNPADPIGTRLSISPTAFAGQLDYLRAQGYQTMTFADLYYGRVPPKPVILTFDDGYRDAYVAAYPELKARHMRATFYVVTGFVDKPSSVSWENLREMRTGGMEIGAHTVDHGDLAIQAPEKQREEILGSVTQIQETLDTEVLTFAYPAGRVGSTSVPVVTEAAIPYAVTTRQGIASQADDQRLLPRLRVLPDIPIETLLQ